MPPPSNRWVDLHVSERLSARHSLQDFASGSIPLDRWLVESARLSDSRNNTRTYVWSTEEDVVVAYFTLCPHIIRKDELRPRDGRGNLSEIPSILLARLALSVELHGNGLGAQLLVDALSRAVSGQEVVGGRYIVADAIDDQAAKFYAHFGFLRSPEDDLRMYLSVKDALTNLT